MAGPGTTSSDILGIEVGHRLLRGVRLDQDTTELTTAAETALGVGALSADGIIDPVVVGPALDELLDRLGVGDRSQVRVGLTIGPRNAGVGSGPAMDGWLEAQAANLRETMVCSGGLGIAFLPSRAVDAAMKLAGGIGIDVVRVDLAPVAAARAIGDQVDDLICIGSGRGWQARMREFEVLEAMENPEVDRDAPLTIVAADGRSRSISRYGWVEIAAELDRSRRLDIGQLAPAVGAAIGVAYESPANLLAGKSVEYRPAIGERNLGVDHVHGHDRAGAAEVDLGEATVQLTHSGSPTSGPAQAPRSAREPRTTALSPLAKTARTAGTDPVQGGRPAGTTRADADAWGDDYDASDPITMFSPDTDVDHIMGKRDSRFGLDHLFGLLLVLAVVLLVAYLVV